MKSRLPEKCFISHAYADAERRNQLLRMLPPHVEPILFPPITVSPEDLVSSELIQSLLGCDGLIYLSGGASARSFWVAFEHDYALRVGKRVFRAELDPLRVICDNGQPLDLAAFASYHRGDRDRVRAIVEHLNRERHFDIWLDEDGLNVGAAWETETERSLKDRLSRGGYAIVFWSYAASQSEWVRAEIQLASEGMSHFNDRVLFARLDDVPLPEFWLRFQEPDVQLFGDADRDQNQRLDDLMVRLYWLIYRKTRQPDA